MGLKVADNNAILAANEINTKVANYNYTVAHATYMIANHANNDIITVINMVIINDIKFP